MSAARYPVVFAALDHRLMAFILSGYKIKDVALALPASRKHGIGFGQVLKAELQQSPRRGLSNLYFRQAKPQLCMITMQKRNVNLRQWRASDGGRGCRTAVP